MVMPLSEFESRRLISLWTQSNGQKAASQIKRALAQEDVFTTLQTIKNAITRWQETGSVLDRLWKGQAKTIPLNHYRFINDAMAENDEHTGEDKVMYSGLGEPASRRSGGAVPGCCLHWWMHSVAVVSLQYVLLQEKCSEEAEILPQAPTQDPHMGWHFQEMSHLLSGVHWYECHQIWWHSVCLPSSSPQKALPQLAQALSR